MRGIRISLHFSFVLLLAYVAYEGWDEGLMPGLVWSVITFLAFFACVVLHELGHSFTARHFGVGVRRILLMPIGGMAEFESIPRSPAQELWITVAGPAVNFVMAAILWSLVSFPEGWEEVSIPAGPADLARALFAANLIMGLFNLIPAFPMDGGRIFRAILAMKLPYLRATYWAVMVAKVLTGIGMLAALYLGRYLTAVLFLFIFMAGEAEYRAVKRRDLDEARLREALDRLCQRPPIDEPPLL